MAQSAVGFLLHNLGSLVQQETSLLQGLHQGIDEIRRELQTIQALLKDADRRKNSDERVKTWVGQVREVAYKVQDIIDEYMYNMAKEDRGGLLRRFLSKTIQHPKFYYHQHHIATELKKVQKEILEISERCRRYRLLDEEGSTSTTNEDGENWKCAREFARFTPDVDIVGIEENKQFLIKQLTNEVQERVVLSVVGMGGLGKTTLVTKAYNRPEVKNYFDCHAWITVSKSYRVEELLRSMIRELYKSTEEPSPISVGQMGRMELVELLINYLQTKRYVVVLDDVWEAIVWQNLQLALPDNGRGSRVIITTRMDDVASPFRVENILHPGPLCNDDAFVLFCNKAFPNKSCPPELKPYAERLVQKCEGLPLAIVTIGGLMSAKGASSLEWKNVENSLNWQLNNNNKLGSMKNILLLSFDDLPYNLKYCFLYCCLFPENYIITQKRLIRLWVAEGFIEERGGLTLEEVAAEYIKELIHRSMLQIVEAGTELKKWVRTHDIVRMHDILRELAISIGREENFCSVQEETQNNKAHHLLIHNRIMGIQSSACHPRSLMLFKIETPALSLQSISSRFKLLRVLHLDDSSIKSVPDELVELFNLRYLSLRNTNIEELPKSIGRLHNLQTLDVRKSKIKILPKGVEKLKKLRHIYTYRFNESYDFDFYDFAQAPDGICNLNCLQSLEGIGANNDTVRKVGNLTQLRKLTIAKVKRDHGRELSTSLQKMEALLFLHVRATSEEEVIDLEALSSPPVHLETIALAGRLERPPLWIGSLQSLSRVFLQCSQLNEDPFSSLQTLPNLVQLHLKMAYAGQELCFRRGCFLKLKALEIHELLQLNQINIENKSLTCIQRLHLFKCPELKIIPKGIQYLTSLQELFLQDMSEELLGRVHGDEGLTLQHIPRIIHVDSTKKINERLR
ncbi:hypothetical protein AAC387_Pa07g3627 [Persea americana]